MPFFDFDFIFKLIFSFLKSRKRVYLLTGADVACGTTARMRRGTKATWQGRGWPARGAGGAWGADTWQEATRVHADAREGRHVAGGSASEGPTG